MRGDIIPPPRPDGQRPAPRQNRTLMQPPQPVNSDTPMPSEVSPSESSQPSSTVKRLPQVDPSSIELSSVEDKPSKKSSRKKLIVGIFAGLIAFLVVSLIGAMVWYSQQLRAVDPSSNEMVKVTIEPGTGTIGIAKILKDNQLIRSEAAFGWYVRIHGKAEQLQSGSYRLSKSEDLPGIVKHLTSGKTDTFSITFLPGATLAQHRKVLIKAGYEEQQVDAALAKTYDHPIFEGKPASADLEGYIYGETYNFGATATPEDILVHTFDHFESIVNENDLINQYKNQGFTLFQGITMASIIQREVATPEDAAQVAQVFKKRYDMDMQLGSDVTYQYIADKTGQERRVDLDSPYNTRRYTGLPPGPISSPGLAALKGVASPAPGDFLYFLSGDDDKTYFARTNEEHERNIQEHCQKKCQII